MDNNSWFFGFSQEVAGGVVLLIIAALVGAIGMGWARVGEWWWAAPVMYALVTGVCLYILLVGPSSRMLSGWWRFGILMMLISLFGVLLYVDKKTLKPAPASQPAIVPQPILAPHPPPPTLTWQQMFQLENIFLGIPRPCFVKITAAAENMGLRDNFLTFLRYNVGSTRGGGESLIPACEIKEDERDKHPELYPDDLKSIPDGMVVVNGGDPRDVKILVEVIREVTGFTVRVGKGPQPDGVPLDWIHIEIGAGSLQR